MSQLICSFHTRFRTLKLETLSNARNVKRCSYFLFSHLKGHNTSEAGVRVHDTVTHFPGKVYIVC